MQGWEAKLIPFMPYTKTFLDSVDRVMRLRFFKKLSKAQLNFLVKIPWYRT